MTELSPELIKRYGISSIQSHHTAHITGLDIDYTGQYIVTCSTDDTIQLYNINTNSIQHCNKYVSRRYGVSNIKFTAHNSTDVVVCSNNSGWSDELRYLSLYDNAYLRVYKGHRNTVISMDTSYNDDMFVSSSLDNTVRLWSLNTTQCLGVIDLTDTNNTDMSPYNAVAIDYSGLIFAVGTQNSIKLFDKRIYTNGCFTTFELPIVELNNTVQPYDIVYIDISVDGTLILCCTYINAIKTVFVLDSYTGDIKCILKLPTQTNKSKQNYKYTASFSVDSQYIYVGCDDNTVRCYSTADGEMVHTIHGYNDIVTHVQTSPNYHCLATTCGKQLVLCLPSS